MSTLGGYQHACGGYHEYTGGYQDACGGYREYTGEGGGLFSTLEGYHEYTGGCSVHRRDTMSALEHFGTNEKREKTATKFPGFLFSYFLPLCSCIC